MTTRTHLEMNHQSRKQLDAHLFFNLLSFASTIPDVVDIPEVCRAVDWDKLEHSTQETIAQGRMIASEEFPILTHSRGMLPQDNTTQQMIIQNKPVSNVIQSSSFDECLPTHQHIEGGSQVCQSALELSNENRLCHEQAGNFTQTASNPEDAIQLSNGLSIPFESQPSVVSSNTNISVDSQSLASLDIDGGQHLSKRMLAGMSGNNILGLWQTCQQYRSEAAATMATGVSACRRNALDLAGKVPFSTKMLSLGMSERELFVDAGQAGGLYGRDDGFIYSLREHFEVKGSKLKKYTQNSYCFSTVQCEGTRWRHLFLIGRKSEPQRWDAVDEYDKCEFVLGYISREDYEHALVSSGRSKLRGYHLSVTPGVKRGWAGKYIKWILFKDLTMEWWKKHVLH